MMTEDFTQLPVGVPVSASRNVIACPRCGRPGALDGRNGSRRCIHREQSTSGPEGISVAPTDHCELAGPPDEPEGPDDKHGFEREAPAHQGLKTPPKVPAGEDSGEWTRGGGSDPNESGEKPRN